MQEESDSEEEILVYAEFDDSVNIDKYRAIHILGEDDNKPIIQMDESFFIGKYEHALGTYMFFEEGAVQGKDPLFDKYPSRCLKYTCHTRKLLTMEHAYITPKEGIEPNADPQIQQKEDVKPIMFSNLQEATDAFKQYFKLDTTAVEPNAMEVDGEGS